MENRAFPVGEPGRRHPARGVIISFQQPTIVFLTICAKDRQSWIANSKVHQALTAVWTSADAWLVGFYLLMPDHVHLFCAPRDLRFTLDQWVTYWKRRFTCLHLPQTGQWQRHFWDTRLRRQESYAEKWRYVQENPVRKGLVESPKDWPFQGMLNVLPW
ncbi:MAG: transposase [Verrucomicrobiota bacterium]